MYSGCLEGQLEDPLRKNCQLTIGGMPYEMILQHKKHQLLFPSLGDAEKAFKLTLRVNVLSQLGNVQRKAWLVLLAEGTAGIIVALPGRDLLTSDQARSQMLLVRDRNDTE